MTAGRQVGRPDLLGFRDGRFIFFFLFLRLDWGGLVWDWLDPYESLQCMATNSGWRWRENESRSPGTSW